MTELDLTTPRGELRNYIDGELCGAASGRTLDNVEPATGEVYSHVPDSDAADVDRAVAAAKRAFPEWAALPASERSQWLLKIADAIDAHADALAAAESRDNGKPVSLARAVDIPRAASNFRFFATAILHTESESHATSPSVLNVTLRSPRGVAGLISPWNLPLYLFTWKIAPALATGNTAVGKPSEVTPMTASLLGEICESIGLPRGVLNIVHGTGPSVGAPLTAHRDVPTISFTGGTATGAAIASVTAPLFKKVSLELGGKNPTIVFGDVDLQHVVPETLRASFANQGQICLCGSRILVERSIHDAYVEAFVARAKALRVGDPSDATSDQGALVSADQLAKVEEYVALAQEEGGTIACGGKRPTDLPERCANGYFHEPTVITGLAPECRVNQEEIFGPVVSIIPFEDEAEAIAIANGTPYGLAASVWTQRHDTAHRVASQLQAGTVWVNCWMVRDLRVPFGGVKQSGVGREGGEEALRFFTEPKNVCFNTQQST